MRAFRRSAGSCSAVEDLRASDLRLPMAATSAPPAPLWLRSGQFLEERRSHRCIPEKELAGGFEGRGQRSVFDSGPQQRIDNTGSGIQCPSPHPSPHQGRTSLFLRRRRSFSSSSLMSVSTDSRAGWFFWFALSPHQPPVDLHLSHCPRRGVTQSAGLRPWIRRIRIAIIAKTNRIWMNPPRV
jgi:hypothetical protein